MDSLSDTETRIREISEKFSKGLSFFVELAKNKREVFNQLKINYSEELREQFENIINNQLVLIHFFDNIAGPDLILDIKWLLYELGLRNDKQTNDFLQPMLQSLYSVETILFEEYKNSVLDQQETLKKSPGKLGMDTKLFIDAQLEYEESLLKKFFEKFDKIPVEKFNQYIKKVDFEVEHAIELGTLVPDKGAGGLVKGAFFAKAVQARIASGAVMKTFSRDVRSIVKILVVISKLAVFICFMRT